MGNTETLRRLAIESIAIVGSILLAFAIEAWWESAQENERRLALLSDLKTEISENIEQLERVVEQQALHAQSSSLLLQVMLGVSEVEAAELDELRRQVSFFPSFRPSWGILDLLTASGDLVLLDNPELRAKLADLKPRAETYVKNQETVVSLLLSDVVLYETGSHLFSWVLPGNAPAKGPETEYRELETAIKYTEAVLGMHELLFKPQGQRVLADFREVTELLP